MTEAQRAQAADPPEHDATDETELDLAVRTVEVGDRTWTVSDLPGGQSWDVFRGAEHEGRPGDRIARITISDTGYFSTDRQGTLRGPYVTLDEAVYPIGLDDPTLLGIDVIDQEHPAPPSPSPRPIAPSEPTPTASGRTRPPLHIAASLIGLGLIVGVVVARRGRAACAPSPRPRRSR